MLSEKELKHQLQAQAAVDYIFKRVMFKLNVKAK